MKEKTHANAEDSGDIKSLLDKIVREQEKIDRRERDVVASHIHIGHYLAELRSLAKRPWARQVKAIGISPRVASRYLKVAENWPDGIGLTESDLLPRLPTDLLKLEWLCRVPLDQLGGLLAELDCKKATRSRVTAAVREALGEEPPRRAVRDVETSVERFVDRLFKAVDRLQETFPEPEHRDRARELLAAGLHDVLQALKPVCEKVQTA
jgi:hypothetical protein